MTLSSIGNISGVFLNMNIPFDPYYFLQQYVPHIDWEKYKEQAQHYKAESKVRDELNGSSSGGMPSGGVGAGGQGGMY